MNKLTIFIRSILAGLCIGLGGAIFIKLGGIIGAIMFAFGLITVVQFKLPLYTGTVGFIELNKSSEYIRMLIILFGNILGAWCISLLGVSGLTEGANTIIQSRIDACYLLCFMRAIGCGLIMTLIVQGGREGNWLMILFGIPLFILLGFYHSIADAAYIALTNNYELNRSELVNYFIIILGNFVGCNIPRSLKYKEVS